VDTAHAIAATAAQGFAVFQCQECADNVRNALVASGFHGQVLELRNREKYEFMVCLSYQGGQTTITETGRHVGIRVGDLVFDNLHRDGMRYDDWLQDFDAPEGMIVTVVSEF
jgi:hypothetical protein